MLKTQTEDDLVFACWSVCNHCITRGLALQVTHNVACLARWMAADLYLREVDVLRFEVST